MDPLCIMFLAIKKGDKASVELLLDCGINVNSRSPVYFKTPLHIAIEENQYDIAKLLIHKGSDKMPLDLHGNSSLIYAIKHGKNNMSMMRLILTDGLRNSSIRFSKDYSALVYALRHSNKEII